MEGRSLTKMTGEFPFRHAIEVRHKSFVNKNFFDLLNAHNVAWVLAHTGPAYTEEVTADFIYVRMHGEDKAFKKGHPKKFLQEWVKKLKEWGRKENFIYFDTEAKKFAPYDAMELAKMVKE